MHVPNHNILIITEHFFPSTGATAQLITDLVSSLKDQNVNHHVLTSSHSSHRCSDVTRIYYSSPKTSKISLKVLTGVLFFFSAFFWVIFTEKKFSKVLIVSNPPFIGLLGPLLLFLKKLPYVFLLQDLFPRSAILSGILPAVGPVSFAWKLLQSLICSLSETTIFLSRSMEVTARTDFLFPFKSIVIHNWSVCNPYTQSITDNPYYEKWNLSQHLTIQYSGNFGRLHEFTTLLESARLLKSLNIQFIFIGDGAKRSQVLAYLDEYNLDNIKVYDYQPLSLLSASLCSCDLAVISLVPGADGTVAPSKLYGILSSGKPIILIAMRNTALAHEVVENGLGFVVEPGDTLALVRLLQNIHSGSTLLPSHSHITTYYQRTYGASKSLLEYNRVLLNHSPLNNGQ